MVGTPQFGTFLLFIQDQGRFIDTVPEILHKRADKVINSIRSVNDSFDVHCKKLAPEIFGLRIDLLQWLANSKENESIIEEILSRIEDLKTGINAKFLSDRFSKSLEIAEKVTASFSNVDIGASIKEFNSAPVQNFINEDELIKKLPILLTSLGLEPLFIKNLTRLLDFSLAVEYSIIASDLYVNGNLELQPGQVDQLGNFMYDSTQSYGAYAIVCRLWNPDEEDLSNEVLGCKILSQAIAVEQGSAITLDNSKS